MQTLYFKMVNQIDIHSQNIKNGQMGLIFAIYWPSPKFMFFLFSISYNFVLLEGFATAITLLTLIWK